MFLETAIVRFEDYNLPIKTFTYCYSEELDLLQDRVLYIKQTFMKSDIPNQITLKIDFKVLKIKNKKCLQKLQTLSVH